MYGGWIYCMVVEYTVTRIYLIHSTLWSSWIKHSDTNFFQVETTTPCQISMPDMVMKPSLCTLLLCMEDLEAYTSIQFRYAIILYHLLFAGASNSSSLFCFLTIHLGFLSTDSYTVEPPKMDSPYYGNLHNADKSPRPRIIPYTIVYVHKETSVLRTPLK